MIQDDLVVASFSALLSDSVVRGRDQGAADGLGGHDSMLRPPVVQGNPIHEPFMWVVKGLMVT